MWSRSQTVIQDVCSTHFSCCKPKKMSFLHNNKNNKRAESSRKLLRMSWSHITLPSVTVLLVSGSSRSLASRFTIQQLIANPLSDSPSPQVCWPAIVLIFGQISNSTSSFPPLRPLNGWIQNYKLVAGSLYFCLFMIIKVLGPLSSVLGGLDALISTALQVII